MGTPGSAGGKPGLLAPLRSVLPWRIALVVGTLINVYGQLLVPWLNGQPDLVSDWLARASAHPGTTALSTVLGYLFPLGVSVYAASGERRQDAALRSRAHFPDVRPDPVFRAGPRGELLDMGERTRRVFGERGVRSAVELFGEETWRRLLEGSPQGTRVHIPALGGWFLVSHAPGPAEGINVYLTRVDEERDGA